MSDKLPPYRAYTIKGHMAGSGFKFSIKHCYLIDDVWYRPVVADYNGNGKTYRQPEEDEIGWDYIPFADDAIIDSVEWINDPDFDKSFDALSANNKRII